METKYIKDFLVLEKLGNSYAAAKEMFVSQSTLVRHIQSLEEELGVTLFERTKSGFVLNEMGRTFLPFAKRLDLLQSQCHAALHQGNKTANILRVTADHKIVDLLIAYRRQYPDIFIEYCNNEDADIKLREDSLDIAFISEVDNADNALVLLPYIEMEIMLLVSESHPLSSFDKVSWRDIVDEPIICTADDDIIYRDIFADFLNRIGFTPKVSMTAPVPMDVISLVRENMGIALVRSVKNCVRKQPEGLKILSLTPEFRYMVYLVYKNQKDVPQSLLNFIRIAKQLQSQHQNEVFSLLI